MEERHLVALEQKRRKLALAIKDYDGAYVTPTTDDENNNPVDENLSFGVKSEIKYESQQSNG